LYPQISLAFAQEIEAALSGDSSVEEALDAAEAAVNDVISNG
jgi:multiple sugar transport system substrate-binding protein